MGALLLLINSIIVIFIGFLLRDTIYRFRPNIAFVYLFTRIYEGILIASLVLNLLIEIHIFSGLVHSIAMFALGLGSIPMCLTLFKYRITPRWIAILGIVGYGLLAFGFLMKLMDLQWSMYYIPLAGLWEITFGVWLITRKKVNQPIGPNYVKKLNGNVTIHIY
nr:DUF4386 domain-containing protein [uncultured Flavobacterium sp.]